MLLSMTACSPVSTEATAEVRSEYTQDPPASPEMQREENLSPAEQQRWAATAGVTGGVVMRVEAVGGSQSGDRLAGYLIRTETKRPVSEEILEQLVALVRARDGFDDSVIKRCRPGLSVGFRLTRKGVDDTAGQEISELVIDFGCDKLAIADGAGKSAVQSYYFDPSHAAFIRLVKRALPDDDELGTLK